ncbi:M20/M25/M40 family metallo-hydrolase [Leucobacter japonicus]|uniref:M20/M25/M40 family metallo-hydrolase n=1 Tax=Leucobacter japonicus TaxID=1461259 RepID=UPI0009495FFE|nr:M20/M25/M40 family metallo-hydrolase [Leucobacter japonicus]
MTTSEHQAEPQVTEPAQPAAPSTLETEALEYARELIRIDSVNTGDPSTIGDGETRAAEFIRDRLAEVGITGELIEPKAGRGSFVVRIHGTDPAAGALLVHAHLDVVPVVGQDWTHPPFGAEIHDGMLYGRGAVDMKPFGGAVVAVLRHFAREGIQPRRDLVVAFLADEENGGRWGAGWLVQHRPELFAGVTESVGEVGGFSAPLPVRDASGAVASGDARRAYLVAVGEKGVASATLTARSRAGHGSRPEPDHAVLALARAVTRIGEYRFPLVRSEALKAFLTAFGIAGEATATEDGLTRALAELGFVGETVAASSRSTATPTVLQAGSKVNIIPGIAQAQLDIRIAPGQGDEVRARLAELAGPDVEVTEGPWWPANTAPVDGPLVDAIRAALAVQDPAAVAVPYLLPASTDNKHFSSIGIAGYGFFPLRVPLDFDVYGQFHAADEHVPVSAIHFCARVTADLLRDA